MAHKNRSYNIGCHQWMNKAVSYRRSKKQMKKEREKEAKWNVPENNNWTVFKKKNKFFKVLIILVILPKLSQFQHSIK